MPLVEVFYRPGERVPKNLLKGLAIMLPSVVSSALHAEENEKAHLKSGDIEVRFRPAGPYDVVNFDLEITIFGSFFPERYENLQAVRIPEIVRDIGHLASIKKTSFFVFVFLGKAGFIDIKPNE